MKSNKPLLSICLTTYKRPHGLQETLESIVRQFNDERVCEQVEVVISDNGDDDETAAIVRSFQERFENIRYFRNETNIGCNGNIFNAVTRANGYYCWYMADDDVIINGAIEFILDKIKDHQYDVVTIEATPIPQIADLTSRREFLSNEAIAVDDPNEFYFLGYCQGGFSVLMFNRDMWLSCADREDALEHWFYYETVLRVLIASHKKSLYIRQPGVATGQECQWVKGGTELFTYVSSNILLQRMSSFGFDKDRILHALGVNSKSIPIILLRAKGHGLQCTIANLRYIYDNLRGASIPYLLLVTMIYFVPNPVQTGQAPCGLLKEN
ncbi:MAG: O antigen biosynthesis abequosyltransferase RfbV, partial [Candidatus Wolfebacteria bacterium GW2011_GWA1_47_6]